MFNIGLGDYHVICVTSFVLGRNQRIPDSLSDSTRTIVQNPSFIFNYTRAGPFHIRMYSQTLFDVMSRRHMTQFLSQDSLLSMDEAIVSSSLRFTRGTLVSHCKSRRAFEFLLSTKNVDRVPFSVIYDTLFRVPRTCN